MKRILQAILSIFMLAVSGLLTACGDKNSSPITPIHTHNYQWADNGDGTHKQHCDADGCDAPDISYGNCDFSNGNCVCGKAKPIVATVGLEFELDINDKKSYRVKSIGLATDTEIVVPSEYDGKPVTWIAGYAFQSNDAIVSIRIPDSILYIDNAAFKDCIALKSITVGSGIKAIAPEAFMNCPIETASIPAIMCADIKNDALKTVAITSGTTIADSALKGCAKLTNMTVGDTVTSIGSKAFQNCRSLASINIPDSTEIVGSYAFDGCDSLAGITVDANNPNYASRDGILYNKTKTKFIHVPKAISGKIVVPDGITSIDGGCGFVGCPSLNEIIIPNTVSFIGFGAFYNCTALVNATIPDSVTSIDDEAFLGCVSLARITFGGTTEQWNAVAKGNDWDSGTGSYTVSCRNGDIGKD